MSAADATPTLLVVDDDVAIVELVQRYFGLHGFRVVAAANGASMRSALASAPIDIVLLDLGLPGEDGLELTRYLRASWSGPVVIVSGRGDTVDRIVGLELGADDYVTKPFDLRELLARVRSVLRRSRERGATRPASAVARFAGYAFDAASRTLVREHDGQAVALTTGEFDLLAAFVARPNQVLSRDDLIGALHGREAGPYDRSIDMQVGRLRRKIEADPADPQLIKSVRGAGYLFAARIERT
ncbi:response regulator [Dokdonella fugitiva]|jgi:DNA-binding response OmpR family regulator|uniref:Two-component system OmpR family response regulator n=1 Tax=Dokdonella fugitiva TaxID=328517 RepID=A0A4R2IF21_9GAMM|nr:response regulator [Dokdonella fugitiva]MBA8882721.1 DNA-binding response OmpR family regulator [Dokdonella fugitiva]TCO43303.1 two-component system OmpR family response regulator [Dokdonella fugitiva]